jgi:hypothetical protein
MTPLQKLRAKIILKEQFIELLREEVNEMVKTHNKRSAREIEKKYKIKK